MKRSHIFPVFLIFSVLFACQIPTAIEVRGTPELHFSAKMDLGNMFAQQLEDGFSDFTLLRCVSTNNFTYLAYRDLYNEPLDINDLPDSDFDPSILGDTLIEDKDLIKPTDGNSKIIPFSGLKFILDGFVFSKAKAFIFVSGTDIIKKLNLGVTVDGKAEQNFEIEASIPSKCDTSSDEYFAPALPLGGHNIEMPLDGSDVILKFRVFAEAGKSFVIDDFNNADIRVELVVWLPLEFEAGSNGAEVTFPAAFFGDEGQDLFGRNPDDENAVMDVIERLSLVIKLNKNPFLGKDMIVSGGNDIEIREQIKTNSLNMVFDEETMTRINDPANLPFAPTFKIVYNSGDTLRFPRVFNAIEIIFSARIKFMIDLKDPPGEKGESGESGETGEPGEIGETGEGEDT